MARLKGAPAELMPPDQWPGWVLTFDRGWSDDLAVQQEIRQEWIKWKAARSRWLRRHRPDLLRGFTMACLVERRRRCGSV